MVFMISFYVHTTFVWVWNVSGGEDKKSWNQNVKCCNSVGEKGGIKYGNEVDMLLA